MDQLQHREYEINVQDINYIPTLKNSHMSLGGTTSPKNGDVLGQKKAACSTIKPLSRSC